MEKEKRKRSLLDKVILGVVVLIAGVVVALSFQNTAKLAEELRLHPYLTAGLVELLFASLLFIRGRQRATQKNVPLFLSIGYFASLGFVTGVNMYGLYGENPIVGPIVGGAISAAMWLMENVLVWLWVDSHRPHKKSMKELKREAQREIKELKLKQKIEWMKWEAQKPDLTLIRKAREMEERRRGIVGDGLPIFFAELEQEKEPAITQESPNQWEDSQESNHEGELPPITTQDTSTEQKEPPITTQEEKNITQAITHNGEPSPMIHPMPPTGNEESPDHSPTVAQESPKDHPEATHNGELSPSDSPSLWEEPPKDLEEKETAQAITQESPTIETDPEIIYGVAWEMYEKNGEPPTRRGLAEAANTTEHRARKAIDRLKAELEQMQREVVAS